MAFMNEIQRFEIEFADRVSRSVDALRAERERRAQYRRTYDELAACSDRDLADLGFSRSDIPDVARAAAGY